MSESNLDHFILLGRSRVPERRIPFLILSHQPNRYLSARGGLPPVTRADFGRQLEEAADRAETGPDSRFVPA